MEAKFYWLEFIVSVGYGAFLSCSVVMLIVIAQAVWALVHQLLARVLLFAAGGVLALVLVIGIAFTGVLVRQALDSLHVLYASGFLVAASGIAALAVWLLRPR